MSLEALARDYVLSKYGSSKSIGASAPEDIQGVSDVAGTEVRADDAFGGSGISNAGTSRPAEADAADPGSVLSRLMKYIPSELLAFYVPIVNLLTVPPTRETSNANVTLAGVAVLTPMWHWGLLLFCSVAGALLVHALSFRQWRAIASKRPAQYRPPAFQMVAAVVAFLAWAAATPGSAFSYLPSWYPVIGTLIALITTFGLNIAEMYFVRSDASEQVSIR